ncbi:50S ribosomal protein L34 [bacterium]|nr:50S ribosomal protein L34 [bacterium]
MGKGTKRTYQPSKRKRARKHGFLSRSKNILTKRRRKGRKRLA